jgi:glycosyltransferase involved in cell wall biosynthesis
MKLSIIIVSYNESRFLEKAVGSCLDQDYDDYEIIIGDDGSDDGSVDIIKRYAETNNIKYFVMERNAKYYIPSIRVSDIIKRALEIADGQYVCVLSGDDFLLIWEVQRAYRIS